MVEDFLEMLSGAPAPNAGEFRDQSGAVRWSKGTLEWEVDGKEGQLSGAHPIDVRLSRGFSGAGAMRIIKFLPSKPKAFVHAILQSGDETLRLQSLIEFPKAGGLPHKCQGGLQVPLEVLKDCVASALAMGASLRHIDASEVTSPEARNRRQKFLFNRLNSNTKSAGVLDLKGTALEDGDLIWVAFRPEIARTHTFSLQQNRLRGVGIEALFDSPHLTGPRAIDMSHNRVSPESLRGLSQSPKSRRLRELGVDNNFLGVEGVAALAESPMMRELRSLHLKNNRLGVEGARVLASSDILTSVQELDLRFNKIGPEGLEALIEGGRLRSLRALWIVQGNRIGAKGVELS